MISYQYTTITVKDFSNEEVNEIYSQQEFRMC